MDDVLTTMPTIQGLTHHKMTRQEWITFWQNVWQRKLLAGLADVQYDRMNDPKEATDEMVLTSEGKQRPKLVRERLEERKANAQNALKWLAIFDEMASCYQQEQQDGDSLFMEKYLSGDKLKVDDSVFQEEDGPKAGGTCETIDGKVGTWQADEKGNLYCIPEGEADAAEEAVGESAPEAPTMSESEAPEPEAAT